MFPSLRFGLFRTRTQLGRKLLSLVLVLCGMTLATVQFQLLTTQEVSGDNDASQMVRLQDGVRQTSGTLLFTGTSSVEFLGTNSSMTTKWGAIKHTPIDKPKGKTVRPTDFQIWPRPFGETNDRIEAQIEFAEALAKDNTRQSLPLKKILVYNGYPEGVFGGQGQFHDDMCPFQACVLTDDRNEAGGADAILFQGTMERPPQPRPAWQIWILYMLESPIHTQSFKEFTNAINWTATYRRDSTIVTPYEKFTIKTTSKPNVGQAPEGKTKSVAWFVSNCATSNGRYEYARELSKFIDVDIFGQCGQLKCPRGGSNKCFEMLKKEYRFYLAFENSNCRDYITEKFFQNALLNDVIPIVMGAPALDYRAMAPPNSYIHVEDFPSPRALAAYLHRVNDNKTLYDQYFQWKGTGEFIDTKFWCRLCAMLHHAGEHVTWYEDIDDWWNRRGTCVTRKRGRRWARWSSQPYV